MNSFPLNLSQKPRPDRGLPVTCTAGQARPTDRCVPCCAPALTPGDPMKARRHRALSPAALLSHYRLALWLLLWSRAIPYWAQSCPAALRLPSITVLLMCLKEEGFGFAISASSDVSGLICSPEWTWP